MYILGGTLMNVLIRILFGAIVGIIAGIITKDKRGLIGDIVVGIIGSFLGGSATSGFTSFTTTDISWPGFFVSILGAVVFIVILQFIKGRR